MRRVLIAVIGAAVLATGVATPALAETETVQGSDNGPLRKMKVNNAEHKIITKLFAPGGKNKVRWLNVVIHRKSDNKAYTASAAWYGADWIKSLSWDDNAPRSCDGFKVVYNDTDNYWRVVVPRACVGKLTNKVKVHAEIVTNTSAIGGEATSHWLSRG